MKVSDEVVFLEEAFDVLNKRFFESALSRLAITIQSTPGSHGHFPPYDAWDDSGLKLKEISYIHSEAYAAGELKHGTISLIEEGSLVIALLCTESIADKTISNIKEVRTRGAKVLCIVSEDLKEKAKEECDNLITIPTVEALFRPSVAVVAMQLFSYHVAKMRNCDIDKPRNLAKSVTVE